MTRDGKVYCDFCAKGQGEVDHLVAGPVAHICNECVELAADVFADKRNAAKAHFADVRENGT